VYQKIHGLVPASYTIYGIECADVSLRNCSLTHLQANHKLNIIILSIQYEPLICSFVT